MSDETTTTTSGLDRPVRKLRHWRQRFRPEARFRWRRRIRFEGDWTEVGAELSEAQYERVRRTPKLQRLWESNTIELVEFTDRVRATPGGAQAEEPQPSESDAVEGLDIAGDFVHQGGGWFLVKLADGGVGRVKGKDAAAALAADQIQTGG